MSPNGLDAKTFFEREGGITYNDFILLPGYIDFSLEEISLETHLTRNIKIKRPIVSSPMDTVTESRMAISMAMLGGMKMDLLQSLLFLVRTIPYEMSMYSKRRTVFQVSQSQRMAH